MTEAKERAAAAIARASHELDRALREIDQIQTFDPALVGHVAHALSNYIAVTAATVEMLRVNLRDHPDPDVPNWVDGIGHAADLMQHSVNRLVSHSSARVFPLKLERGDLGKDSLHQMLALLLQVAEGAAYEHAEFVRRHESGASMGCSDG